MLRRQFMKKAGHGTAFACIAGSNLLFKGCTTVKAYDLIITRGMIYDGSGNPGKEADIAIKGDRIVKIGSSLNTDRASEVIDATGKAVSPGFIDPHTHTDIHLLVNPKAESKIRQGVTTEIGGNCGSSRFPLSESSFEKQKEFLRKEYELELNWKDINGFFGRLKKSGSAVNFTTLLGNGTLRDAVIGPYDHPPSDDELQRMKQMVREHMEAGVVGLSSGLEYTPSCFSSTEELVELCREVASYNGVYSTHIRDEEDRVLDAVDEAITISRKARVSLQISHLKANYRQNWDKLDTVLAKIEEAQKELGNVLADRYPYHAFSTGLSLFFPLWAREGKTEDFINRLKDRSLDEKLRTYVMEMERKMGSWENVLISSVVSDENKRFIGKTVLDAAAEAGKPCYEFIRDLLIEEENHVSIIGFGMSEDNLKRVLAHPLVVIGSDGNSLAPYGLLSKGNPHPRSYGTFPRVLGKFARDEHIIPLEVAIQKMTGLTAEKFRLHGRGYLREGYYADVVVFNPDTVIDKATWLNPHTYPDGIDYVIVNGRTVITEGEHTGELPGRILRHTI